jgi:hypothetical protein
VQRMQIPSMPSGAAQYTSPRKALGVWLAAWHVGFFLVLKLHFYAH